MRGIEPDQINIITTNVDSPFSESSEKLKRSAEVSTSKTVPLEPYEYNLQHARWSETREDTAFTPYNFELPEMSEADPEPGLPDIDEAESVDPQHGGRSHVHWDRHVRTSSSYYGRTRSMQYLSSPEEISQPRSSLLFHKHHVRDFNHVWKYVKPFLHGLVTAILIIVILFLLNEPFSLRIFVPTRHELLLEQFQRDVREEFLDTQMPVLYEFTRTRKFRSARDFAEPAANASQAGCVDAWKQRLLAFLPSDRTDPAVFAEVLEAMHLNEFVPIRIINAALQFYLTEPRPLADLLDATASCAELNIPLRAFACELLARPDIYEPLGDMPDLPTRAYEAIHYSIAINSLSTGAYRSNLLYQRITEYLGVVKMQDFEDYVDNHMDKRDRKFLELSYRSAALLDLAIAHLASAQDGSLPLESRVLVQRGIQLQILESVYEDLLDGYEDNAIVGLHLALFATRLPQLSQGSLDIYWGYDWTNLLIPWGVTSTMGIRGGFLKSFSRMFFPQFMCSPQSSGRQALVARTFSLWLDLNYYGELDGHLHFPGLLHPNPNHVSALKQLWSETNLKYAMLPMVDGQRIRDMLDLLGGVEMVFPWTDSSITSNFDENENKEFFAFWVWTTIWLAGFGSELFFGVQRFTSGFGMMKNLVDSREVGRNSKWHRQWMWIYSQMAFSTMAMIALFDHTALSIPFLIIGLWKFGHPETFQYFHAAFAESTDQEPNRGRTRSLTVDAWSQTLHAEPAQRRFFFMWCPTTLEQVENYCNGLGTLLHHSAASFIISSLICNLQEPTQTVFMIILPTIIQHNVVVLKYFNLLAYNIIEFALELWFEWECISNIEHLSERTSIVALYVLLIAHWLYISGAFLNFLRKVGWLWADFSRCLWGQCKRSCCGAEDSPAMSFFKSSTSEKTL